MTLQEIKQQFFGFRNGIVAKAFLDAGYPHKTIFGLQLPQIAEIARKCGKSVALGRQLWDDRGCRESRLLACRLFDASVLTLEEAEKMASDVLTKEEADYLAFALLRLTPYASELANKLAGESKDNQLKRYVAEALRRNLDAMADVAKN